MKYNIYSFYSFYKEYKDKYKQTTRKIMMENIKEKLY